MANTSIGVLEKKVSVIDDSNAVPTLAVTRDQNKERFAVSGQLTAAAMATTDFAVLTPGAAGTVRVRRIRVSAVATAGTFKTLLVNRNTSTADTGGTAVTVTPAGFETADSASATCAQYTTNPTVGGTATTLFKRQLHFAADTLHPGTVEFKFDDGKPLILRGSTQQLALNLNSEVTAAGMNLVWEMDFEEDST